MENRNKLLAELQNWVKTSDGRSLVVHFVEQYVEQRGKYNVNIGEGSGVSIGDTLDRLDTSVLVEIRDLLRLQLPPPPLDINWPEVSRTLLEERFQLTTNLMTRGEDIAYQIEQVYVPLGLVERKKVPRRKEDVPPEQGSELYREGGKKERSPRDPKLKQEEGKERSPRESEQEQEVEITKRYEHEEFLKQVLQQGQSPKSQGKRLAIIGEPGAGKTTLLQQISRWVSTQFPDSIAIWVSLTELQGDTLETYLENRWLQRVIREAGGADVSPADKQHFAAQFERGRVWLLLDGLDEMQVSGNPLSEIQRQMQEGGWLQQAKILLTCRLNLWDGDRNALTGFDTYRTLEFSYPEQVEQFVERWFSPRGKADLGQALCAALKEPGRERIRDLVKNPLRLTLLCFSWYLQQGQLPETQAELYERFVNRIYEWKQEQFPTTPEQRKQLNRALAELSRDAIDDVGGQQTRFRLRERFVKRYLDRSLPEERKTLFDLAMEIGWLNKVGVDADDPEQAVYAFYHTTFEEYFAALGIGDRHFFLNHIPKNPFKTGASYRIFEPQWKQVFLLWLGRKDIGKFSKDALIHAMVTFKDGCKGFYSDRAFLLAAEGISEFKKYTHSDNVMNQLMQWAYGSYNFLQQAWDNFFDAGRVEYRKKAAKAVLSNTDFQMATRELIRLLATAQNQYTRKWAVFNLSEISPDRDTEIRLLIPLLNSAKNKFTRREVTTRLGQIEPNNKMAIDALFRLLDTSHDRDICQEAIKSLGQIGRNNKMVIDALTKLLVTSRDRDICKEAAKSLGQIDAAKSLGQIGRDNEMAIQELVRLLDSTCSETIRWESAKKLGQIGRDNEMAIRELVRLLSSTRNEAIRRCATYSLSQIGKDNEMAIQELVQLLDTTQNEFTRWSAAYSLGQIGKDNEMAIQELVQLLDTTQNEFTRWSAAYSLGQIGRDNEIAIRLDTTQNEFTRWSAAYGLGQIIRVDEILIWEPTRLLITTQDEYIREKSATLLSEISRGDKTLIQSLVWLLTTTQDKYIRRRSVTFLGAVSRDNATAVEALARLLDTSGDEDTRWKAAESLGRIGAGNETAIGALVRLVETSRDAWARGEAAKSLGRIGAGNETAIGALVRLVETSRASTLRTAAESLGRIGAGNETVIGALVRLVETARDEYTRREAAERLGQIDPGNEMAIAALARLVETSRDASTLRTAAESLGRIGAGNETVIGALVRLVETARDEYTRREAAERLGQIDPGNEMAIAALARLVETSRDASTLRTAAESLGRIGAGNETAIGALVRLVETARDEYTRREAAESLG
ncbi:HEAT repeat domain-containing protein, partial [Baaleninema simplex]|uniref:HEAT repeat domain-containing protein n=1 Tax=Baaleninema simplex TaxID=2862350 RepID=UPI00068496DE